MWYTPQPAPQQTVAERACLACDEKDIKLIKSVCPEVAIDNVTWYDTMGQGLEWEIKYLRVRGLIIIHPNHVLVRFKEGT